MSKEILGEGNFKRLVREDGWEYVESVKAKGAVFVLPVIPAADGYGYDVILISQYREPQKSVVVEVVAGMVGDHDPDETHETAGFRELEEETGYRAHRLIKIGEGPGNSGLTPSQSHIFMAQGLVKVSEGGGVDEGENITVHRVHSDQIQWFLENMMEQGCKVEMRTYATLYLAEKYLSKDISETSNDLSIL